MYRLSVQQFLKSIADCNLKEHLCGSDHKGSIVQHSVIEEYQWYFL